MWVLMIELVGNLQGVEELHPSESEIFAQKTVEYQGRCRVDVICFEQSILTDSAVIILGDDMKMNPEFFI